MKHTMISCIFVLFSGTISMTQANEGTRVPVFVTESCDDDSVGRRVVYNIRENLNRSSAFVSTDEYLKARIRLSLVCLQPEEPDNGNVSYYAYAMSLLNTKGYFDFHISHGVGSCGANRVAHCAENVLVVLSDALRKVQEKERAGEIEFDGA